MASTPAFASFFQSAALGEQKEAQSVADYDWQNYVGVHGHHDQHYANVEDTVDERVEEGDHSFFYQYLWGGHSDWLLLPVLKIFLKFVVLILNGGIVAVAEEGFLYFFLDSG